MVAELEKQNPYGNTSSFSSSGNLKIAKFRDVVLTGC